MFEVESTTATRGNQVLRVSLRHLNNDMFAYVAPPAPTPAATTEPNTPDASSVHRAVVSDDVKSSIDQRTPSPDATQHTQTKTSGTPSVASVDADKEKSDQADLPVVEPPHQEGIASTQTATAPADSDQLSIDDVDSTHDSAEENEDSTSDHDDDDDDNATSETTAVVGAVPPPDAVPETILSSSRSEVPNSTQVVHLRDAPHLLSTKHEVDRHDDDTSTVCHDHTASETQRQTQNPLPVVPYVRPSAVVPLGNYQGRYEVQDHYRQPPRGGVVGAPLVVSLTRTGKKYHSRSCRGYSFVRFVPEHVAQQAGYDACAFCSGVPFEMN